MAKAVLTLPCDYAPVAVLPHSNRDCDETHASHMESHGCESGESHPRKTQDPLRSDIGAWDYDDWSFCEP